jgi:hypothetical protein
MLPDEIIDGMKDLGPSVLSAMLPTPSVAGIFIALAAALCAGSGRDGLS